MLALACASAPSAPAEAARQSPLLPGALRVLLVFGDEVDLDLYVTGPDQETVYFANSPSRVGGALERDLRCDAPGGPRTEVVTFPAAAPGRYRVGVDFPERCRAVREPVPFVVILEHAGSRRERRGEIVLGRFLPRVLEVEVPAAE